MLDGAPPRWCARRSSGPAGGRSTARGDEVFAVAFADAAARARRGARDAASRRGPSWADGIELRVRIGIHAGRCGTRGRRLRRPRRAPRARISQRRPRRADARLRARPGEASAGSVRAARPRRAPSCAGCRSPSESSSSSTPGARRRASRRSRIGRQKEIGLGARMRVVLADDSVLLREGIARLLEDGGLRGRRPGGQRRRADAEGALLHAGRRDRRHPDAADPHRRGAARRAGDPRAATRARACSSSRSTSRPATRSSCSPTSAEGVGYLLKDRVSDIEEFAAAVQPGRRRAARRSIPTVVSQLVGRRREDDPLARADPARARGARADGRGPLEPGDRRAAVRHAARGREARDEHLQKLRLPADAADHRRVLAVLTYLRS